MSSWHPSGSQVSDSVLDVVTTYSLSTNATADDNEGAGRNLGLCFKYFGIALEIWLSGLAEKRGHGPNQAAARINTRRALAWQEDSSKPLSAALTNGQKIVQDCQKILGYVRSKTPLTFRQACDRITDLNVRDPFVRDLFKQLDAKSVLKRSSTSREDYIDDVSFNSSRKALVSLADTELYGIVETLNALPKHGDQWKGDPGLISLCQRFMGFMRNNEKSFLFFRLLMELPPHLKDFLVGLFKDKDVSAVLTSTPETMEWAHTDQLLSSYLSIMSKEVFIINKQGLVLEVILRLADKLPLTFSSEFFKGLVDLHWYDDGRNSHLFSVMFLLFKGVRAAGGHRDEFSLKLSDLEKRYSPFLLPLLQRLSCDPDMILCHILIEGYENEPNIFVNGTDALVIPPLERLERMCQALAEYVDSENVYHQRRARDHVAILLAKDIYCRTAIRKALITTKYSQSHDAANLLASTLPACAPKLADSRSDYMTIYRLCDVEGRLLRVSGSLSALSYSDQGNEGVLQVWKAGVQDVAWLRVYPTSADYSRYAIHAGVNVRGEREYLACLPRYDARTRRIFTDFFTVTTEGAITEDGFYVLALRYDPKAYIPCETRLSRSMDSTGPFSWVDIEAEDAWDVGPY